MSCQGCDPLRRTVPCRPAPELRKTMETYTYVNIFETKGLEYLLLICFLVLFVFLIRYLKGPNQKE